MWVSSRPWRALCTLLFVFAAAVSCRGGEPVATPGRGAPCRDRPACEDRLAHVEREADVAALLARLEELGAPGWSDVWGAVQRGAPVASLPTEGAILALHGLGRVAGQRHVVLSSPPRHLFPVDALVAFGAGLPAIVSADPAQRAGDATLIEALERAVQAARSFDYVAAAAAGEELRAAVAGAVSPELGWRGRIALRNLAAAGLLLERDAPSPPPPTGEASTPYAAFLTVRLADDPDAAYASRRTQIEAWLPPNRAQALARHYADPDGCPPPFSPPMEAAPDLLFAEHFAKLLDPAADPQTSSGDPRSMTRWLPRYERMVAIVADGHAWSHVGALLQQRGEVDGLSAAGTTTYRKVSELAVAHAEALTELFEAEPRGAPLTAVMGLAFRKGILRDPPTLEATAKLIEGAVRSRVVAAEDEAELFEAAGTAFAAGSSFPGPLQGAQLGTLLATLDQKLGGPFGERAGWRMAGLHAAHAAIEALLGRQNWAGRGATRVAASLRGDDLPAPELGRLARAAARYAGLVGTSSLVVAPAQPSAERAMARDELRRALEGLAPAGPRDGAERKLVTALADLADRTIATLAGRWAQETDQVTCGATETRDDLEALRRDRRALLRLPAFRRGDGPWRRRARVVALVVSDAIDAAGGVDRLAVAPTPGRRILDEGLDGWLAGELPKLVFGGYRLARAALDARSATGDVAHEAVSVLASLSTFFEGEATADTSLLALLAEVGAAVDAEAAGDDLPGLLVRYARGAYERDALDQGDLLLLLAMSVARGSERPVPHAAIELARARKRPVLPGLLMHAEGAAHGDPAPVLEAMRRAVATACDAPDASAVIAVRGAIHDAQRGRLDRAQSTLQGVVARAERDGLVVPRQRFTFHQVSGRRVFNLSHSLSFGRPLLANAGQFQLGIGYQSASLPDSGLDHSFEHPGTVDGRQEAARYYAHVTALAAVYAFAQGAREQGRGLARKALDAWTQGVRLGEDRVPVGNERRTWVQDAPGVIAVLAQLAADAGHPILAGDLWTLVRDGLARDADAEAVRAVLEPPPAPFHGIDALAPVLERAKRPLGRIAAVLPCAGDGAPAERWMKPRCDDYPDALALRVANLVSELPRLVQGAAVGKPECQPYRHLDELFGVLDRRQYDGARMLAAVTSLRDGGHPDDAAVLLVRQRQPQHCAPALVQHARELSRDEALGLRLRGDLASVAISCAPQAGTLAADVKALDDLTRRMADPSPSFRLLLFTSELALTEGRWKPLHALTAREGFVRRWQRMGPDLGIAALALHHAAAAMVGETIDEAATEPFRRLFCTTFPAARRGPFCHMIDLLRDPSTPNREAVARQVVSEVVGLAAKE